MSAAKRPAPRNLDLAQPQNDKPRAQQCPRCQAPVLRALVGHVAAVDVRADPYPLNLAQELAARLQGRITYCLRIKPHLRPRLILRSPEHIAAGRCTHLVVADHHCTRTHRPPEPPVGHPTAPSQLF